MHFQPHFEFIVCTFPPPPALFPLGRSLPTSLATFSSQTCASHPWMMWWTTFTASPWAMAWSCSTPSPHSPPHRSVDSQEQTRQCLCFVVLLFGFVSLRNDPSLCLFFCGPRLHAAASCGEDRHCQEAVPSTNPGRAQVWHASTSCLLTAQKPSCLSLWMT